ncbi:hypothetical protein V8E36_009825 [Tilletia maclaganii]
MPPLSLRHGGNADAAMNQQQQQQQNSYTSDPYEPTAERDTHNATRDRWSSRSSAPGHPDFHHHPTPSLSVSSFIRRDDAHLSNRPQDRSIHPSPSPSAPIALARIQSTPSTHTFSNQAAPSRSSDQAYQHPRPIATAKRRALPDSATDSSSNKRRAQGDGGKTPTHVSSSQHYAGDNEETHDEPERSRSILDPQLSTGQLSAPSSSRPRNSGPSGSQPASSTQSPQADQAQTPATEAPGSPGKKLWIKRSHAKRTCLRCQRLKARCVLPDLNVYSSEAPLPAALRCERCVKRGADCVVDDNRGPKPPPPGYQVQGSLASRSVGSAQVAAAATTSRYHPAEHFATAAARSALFPGSDEMGQIWHSSAARAVHWPSTQRPHAAGRSQDGRQGGPSLLAPASQVFAVLRPLALFSQMVNGLISKSSVEFETSFGSARCMYVVRAGLTPALLGLIEDRYNTLLGWAPYLPELNILRTSASDPATTNADNRFLLTVASWTTLRGEGGERALVTEARKALKADVVAGTLRALSSVPASLDVARALVLLAIHSTIDFELDRSSTADHIPSRGLIAAARTIVSKLDPPQLLVDLSSAGSRGMPVSRASALTRADRIKDLSHVALCFTIATQESHIALSGFSLRSTALDNLPDVDERMLFELEHEANTVLGNHQAFRFLALTSRVRTFKRLDTCVRGMYLIRLPSDEYGDLKDRVEEMFAEFDLLRSEQEVTFSRFSSSLADKVGTWSLIEIDAIEECICQRFCNYISIGTFHPPAEIDTYKVLQNNMTSTAQRDFTAHVFNRNESTMTRYLSLVSNMGDWLNFVPQTITFALVLRAAKVILEQCTARMIGWGTVASNVETLELLITSAARALVASAGSSAGGELGGGPGAGSLHAKRSADGRRAGNVDRGIGARAEGSEDADKRTYAFSPRYPCGSAESIPLICAYLLHEIAIALNRRTKLYRLMGAQKRRAEAEARMLAREHALARDASGGRGEDEGRGGSASTTELDGRSSRQSNVTASGGSMVSSWTSANSALGYERGGGTGPGSSSGTSMGQITPGGQQQPLSASLSALPGPGQNQSTDAFASPPSQPDRASSSMSISAAVDPTFSLQPYGMGGGPAGGGLAGQDRTGPEPILSSGLPQQGRSKLMLDTMVPASWIDTVFQANGFTFNPADFS